MRLCSIGPRVILFHLFNYRLMFPIIWCVYLALYDQALMSFAFYIQIHPVFSSSKFSIKMYFLNQSIINLSVPVYKQKGLENGKLHFNAILRQCIANDVLQGENSNARKEIIVVTIYSCIGCSRKHCYYSFDEVHHPGNSVTQTVRLFRY